MKKKTTLDQLKLHKISKPPLEKDRAQINAVRTSRLSTDMVAENVNVLERCRQDWDSLRDFRERRRRNRKYARGDQWHELTTNDAGDVVTEETLIKERGKLPLKQNVIRQMIRSLLGQYRTNRSKTMVIARQRESAQLSEMLTNTLQSCQDLNDTQELDARNLEEFIISGASIGKVRYTYWKTKNREDGFVTNVNPNRVFFNTDVQDVRLFDIRRIGEVLDLPLQDVISSFATNEEEAEIIRSWYTGVDPQYVVHSNGLTAERMDTIDFFMPSDINKARVIEVWELASEWRTYAHDYMDGSYNIVKESLEEIAAINQERIEMGTKNGMRPEEIPLIDAKKRNEQFWTVKFLTPYGQCLYQSETIYDHEEHPYVLSLYPLLDGEVWGLVEDVIDQQRYINRLISLIDFIMGSAAKGVLLVPESAIPDDMDISDFAEEWTKYNGVIKFKAKPGVDPPKQVSANITNIGAHELLGMQMKLIQDISGVSGAIQGHEAKSGTPSSLYAQEALNSSTNTRDLFEMFASFKKKRDEKLLKVLMQFYKEKRYIAISGNKYSDYATWYDPQAIKNLEFNLVVTEGIDTPVFRQIVDEQLIALLERNVIDGKMYLEHCSLPFADKLLQSISLREQQMMEQQAGQLQIPEGSPEQLMQGADPKAQAVIKQLMAGAQEAA